MNRLFLLVLMGGLTWSGWSFARQQELLNHANNIQLQTMQNASCPPSSNPGGQ